MIAAMPPARSLPAAPAPAAGAAKTAPGNMAPVITADSNPLTTAFPHHVSASGRKYSETRKRAALCSPNISLAALPMSGNPVALASGVVACAAMSAPYCP